VRGPRLLLVLLLLTALTLTALDARDGAGSPFDALRRGADAVLGPAQRALGAGVQRVTDVFAGDSDEQAALRRENERLRSELRRTEDLRRRVAELDALLELKDYGNYPMVPARVTAVGSSLGFEATVTIDAGSSDGIQTGQTVVDGDGLVGRTLRVGPFTSSVLLLTDPGFTVGARLTRAGTVGLATGGGRELSYALVEGEEIRVGEALLTTGSDTFVPGVPVGRVSEVGQAAGALVTTATVRPFADVTSLDLVGVVTEPPRRTPRVPLEPSARP
jgi:rod shape-determining protein MreC